ncbi:unnamed protein product [Taenia asiatica]|uniref:Uncharacterized protein n=1 Tax=Taenia asiatica TaxID=60517 RepID=A0A0R3W8G7_TAEAS|nr:unnamed protein product [Taenia asiatica]
MKKKGDVCINARPLKDFKQPFHDPPADILKLHASLFTKPKDFCPRTLKSATPSRIRELACYNPPRRRQAPEHLEEIDLTRAPPQSNNGDLKAPTRNASADKGKDMCCLDLLEDIEYIKFSSAVTNDILMNRQFGNRQVRPCFDDVSIAFQEQQLKAIRQIAEKLNVPAKLMVEFSFHMSQSDAKKASLNPDVNAIGTKTINKKGSGAESRNSEGGLPSPAALPRGSCHTSVPSRSRQSDFSLPNIENESDVESESYGSTISLASLSPAKDQPSLQQPSKSTSERVTPSKLSDTMSTMNSEIEETSQFLSSLEIKKTVESDGKSDHDDYDDDDDDCDGDDDGHDYGDDVGEEQTDLDDVEESYTIESFEDDE